jgi:hypothetical protein
MKKYLVVALILFTAAAYAQKDSTTSSPPPAAHVQKDSTAHKPPKGLEQSIVRQSFSGSPHFTICL